MVGRFFVAMVQCEGLAAVLLIVFLAEGLNDRPILRYLHPTQWCMVDLINTTRPLVGLLFNRVPTVSKRALSAVGCDGYKLTMLQY